MVRYHYYPRHLTHARARTHPVPFTLDDTFFLLNSPCLQVNEFHQLAEKIQGGLSGDIVPFKFLLISTDQAKLELTTKAIEIRDSLLEWMVGDCDEQNKKLVTDYEGILERLGRIPANEVRATDVSVPEYHLPTLVPS